MAPLSPIAIVFWVQTLNTVSNIDGVTDLVQQLTTAECLIRNQLKALLRKFTDFLPCGDSDVGRTNALEDHTDIGTDSCCEG